MAENENVSEQESEQFNSMLNAAQKHVGNQSTNNSLSQSQIEAMLAVNDDEDEESQAESADGSGDSDGVSDSSIADKFREGIAADSQAAADEADKKKIKEKKPKVKKEKKPLDKAKLAKMLTALAVIVALVLGYLVCLVFFTDAIKSPNEEFAIRAAKAVASKLPAREEIYFYKAYVRNGAAADECILYAVTTTKRESDSEKTDMYRIVIRHDAPNKINVYYTLDTESPEYIKLRDSEDEKDRIQASRLKNYSDEIANADKEIQINSPDWHKINCTIINKSLIPKE